MMKHKIYVALLTLLFVLLPHTIEAQNKLDLDDLSIKGELHDDNRLRMLARDRNELRNFVKFRTNYRNEMIEGLPRPVPQYEYKNIDLYDTPDVQSY